jgi:hypothetical protein
MMTRPIPFESTIASEPTSFELGVEEACLWRELIDRLIERGESLGEAIGMADDMMRARHLRLQEEHTPSEPPPPSVRKGDEEPLG